MLQFCPGYVVAIGWGKGLPFNQQIQCVWIYLWWSQYIYAKLNELVYAVNEFVLK